MLAGIECISYIAFGASPFGNMNRLSMMMMMSSLLLSVLGENFANLFSVSNTLVIQGHSPRCVEDSFAPPHMRHVFALPGKRVYVPTRLCVMCYVFEM